MTRPSISILLAASILACPLWCKGGAACCHSERTDRARVCCGSCEPHADDATTHDSHSSDHQSRAPARVDCICSGAVVEGFALHDWMLEGNVWAALPSADQHPAVFADFWRHTASWEPMPDDGMNPGRAKRCLMMSYLC